jgi:leucyl aminopeptidase
MKTHTWENDEIWRRAGNDMLRTVQNYKLKTVTITNLTNYPKAAWFFAEGMALGNYQFIKHKTEKDKVEHTLHEIRVDDAHVTETDINHLNVEVKASNLVKDLVNEPVNILNAPALAETFENMGAEAGFKVEVWNKKKIETMKFGGLLAVNQGSVDEPRFTIMEYKPENTVNEKPIVLVGKGVVYDTGGLSLKRERRSTSLRLRFRL